MSRAAIGSFPGGRKTTVLMVGAGGALKISGHSLYIYLYVCFEVTLCGLQGFGFNQGLNPGH